jgi:hypothetical protein
VHETLGTVHFAAEDGAEGLMPKADAEHGDLAGEVLDGVRGNTVVFERFARSGRDNEMGRVEGNELVYRHLVITEDFDIRAEFAEILDEVVGKGVIVIDEDEHKVFLSRVTSYKLHDMSYS